MNEGAMAETDKHGDQDGGRIAKVIARAGLESAGITLHALFRRNEFSAPESL